MKYTAVHAKLGSDINEHLITLYNLGVALNAKKIFELGTRTGESMVALLEAVHTTGGILWSIDVTPCEEAKKKVADYNLGSRWKFIQSDDIEFGLKWGSTNLVDMVFVDTSHQYEHTKREIEVFEPLLRSGGIMAFHDTVSFPDGVLKPIKEFLADHPDYLFENHAYNHGLGIIRKP